MKRIYTCKSGWSIDLDKITYIGLPEIDGEKAKFKIGMDSNVSKENKEIFIVYEEDFSNTAHNIQLCYFDYLKNYCGFEKGIKEAMSRDNESRKDNSENGHISILGDFYFNDIKNQMMGYWRHVVGLYIEAEIKSTINEIRDAWIQRVLS